MENNSNAENNSAKIASFGRRSYELNEQEQQLYVKVDAAIDLLEQQIILDVSFASDIADVSGKYLLKAGGKRIRPRLVFLGALSGNDEISDDVMKVARAIELIHLASLYHDDVMDDAPVRRGVTAAHYKWSNSVAILTGDLLFSRACSLIAGLQSEIIYKLAKAFERLCLGQMHETLGPAADEDKIAHYLSVLSDKTGSLLALAVELGAIVNGSSKRCSDSLAIYGEKLGVAFQIIDDVLDIANVNGSLSGKTPGTDIKAGVTTMPMLLLAKEAKHDGDSNILYNSLTNIVSELDALDKDSEEYYDANEKFNYALAKLQEHKVTAETQAIANNWAEEALSVLTNIRSEAVRGVLEKLATGVLDRDF